MTTCPIGYEARKPVMAEAKVLSEKCCPQGRGDTSRLDYKVDCMNDAILQMSDYQSGVLDISFTIWPNQVGYTPFA